MMLTLFISAFAGGFAGCVCMAWMIQASAPKDKKPIKSCTFCDFVTRNDNAIKQHVENCEKHPFRKRT